MTTSSLSRRLHRAAEFIDSLPDHFPAPEIGSDESGDLHVEWLPSRNSMFSVEVAEELIYAWNSNGQSGHGVVALYRADELVPMIERVLRDGGVGLEGVPGGDGI